MHSHEKINYVEFPAKDMAATKTFFNTAFNWQFTDYGPDYTAFDHQGLDGGFFSSEHCADASKGSALIVFYSNSLPETQAKVEAAGGKITQAIFSFPGGHRFHFTDPSDNEFAVWSDQAV